MNPSTTKTNEKHSPFRRRTELRPATTRRGRSGGARPTATSFCGVKPYFRIAFLMTIALLFYNCSNSPKDKTIETLETIVIEYTNAEINLYKVKPSLYQTLDTIIESVNACQKTSRTDNFIYGLFVDDVDTSTIIGIEYLNRKKLYCDNIDGVFIYKNSIFTYSGKFLDEFFEQQNRTVKFRCKKHDILMHDYGDHSDKSFCFYKYAVKNKQLKSVGYDICGKSWFDEKYSYYKLAE